LFGGHGVLQFAEAGRFATPTAPRPASAYDSPWGPGHHMSDLILANAIDRILAAAIRSVWLQVDVLSN